jgi:hypothetical protein
MNSHVLSLKSRLQTDSSGHVRISLERMRVKHTPGNYYHLHGFVRESVGWASWRPYSHVSVIDNHVQVY